MVTGAIRNGLPHAAPAAPSSQHAAPAAEQVGGDFRPETVAEPMRQPGTDEKIEIPTFLRRQTS